MFNPLPSWLSMDKWLKVSIVAAVLLAGAGALYRFGFVLPGIEQARRDGEAPPGERTNSSSRSGATPSSTAGRRRSWSTTSTGPWPA